MDVQEAVAESQTVANADDNGDGRRDAQRKFTMGPNDSLEGKLVYDGSVHVDGRAEGEFRVTGNLDVASGAMAKLTLGKNAKLSGDIVVRRLQIEDGASLNGHVRMGDVEQHPSGG